MSSAPAQSEAACSYDLDECDIAWLKIVNAERAMCGHSSIHEDQLERVIEQFELSCWDKIQSILRNEEGLGIEYDENVICDVCRSPDSEEGNEMVFCDSCNICVHQACYGITRIPDGQWLCCTCNLGKRPKCVLCPNKGGAMKSTRSGQKWAHVSCALWIPEVSIGCVEKMEPITKISSIPQSRWALICVLCRERVGACIQCSVKTCKTAYHVTCAFKHGLEMRAIIEDENADDGVKLRSYCEKHSKSSKKEKSVCSGSEDDDSKRKKRKDMTSEEKNQARAARLQEIEAEFFKHVSIKDVSLHLNIDNDALHYIYNYWKLKRKTGNNKPLLPPKSEDVDMLSQKREQADLEKMKMFVQLRQDLERVRNLCYMVSRREKLSRSFFRLREQTFHKQAAVLESVPNLPNLVFQAVCEANHGPSIYDRLYSHDNVEEHKDFDSILARIEGSGDSGDEKKPELNGLLKDIKNPYKKVYFNGTSKRRSGSLYGSSSASAASSSDEKTKPSRIHPSSTTDDEKPALATKKKIKNRKTNNNNNKSSAAEAQRRRKRNSSSALSKIDTTSDEEEKPRNIKSWSGDSKSRLKQVERELGYSGSDSDELIPIHHHSGTQKIETKTQMSSIYSDSDSSDVSMKNTDSQKNKLRTKASVKEFSHKPSTSKQIIDNKKKTKVDLPSTNSTSPSKKEASTKPKKDYVPSDLIVPQRQAAKKATENLKSTTTSRTSKESTTTVEEPLQPISTSQPNKVDDKLKKDKFKTKLTKETSLPATAKKDTKREREENKSQDLKKDDTKKEREDLKREKEDSRKEKEDHKKEEFKERSGTGDIFDIDKELDKLENQEILAYVPQRQAAKKAAEHIKSGLGKAPPSVITEAAPPIEVEKPKPKEVKKEVETRTRRKSSSQSSTSSSTSSSSDSSSSSSSESDDEPSSPPQFPTALKSQSTTTATVQQKTAAPPRSESREQSSTKRNNSQDWPFLDKGTKPTRSSSSESSSDSSRSPSPIKPSAAKQQAPIIATTTPTPKSPDKRQQSTPTSTSSQREEQARNPQRGKGRHTAGRGRVARSFCKPSGDVDVRTRNLSDSQRSDVERERNISKSTGSRKGKSDEVVEKERENSPPKLQSSISKTDKKINDFKDAIQTNLEKEILERKAGKQGAIAARTKSTLDRLFGNSDKKIDKVNNKIKSIKNEKVKSTVKENKEPLVIEKILSTSPKKSPIKNNKSIDEIFTERIISTNDNKVEVKEKQNKQLHEIEQLVLNVTKAEEISELEEPKITDEKLLDLDAIAEKVSKAQENRSIFSPSHLKDSLLDFDDNLDGFGISKEEETMKGPLTFTFGNSAIFKEDSKEDSARETLNLVEKLRMELSKKSTSCDVDDSVSVSSSTKNDNIEFTEQVVPPSVSATITTELPNVVQPENIEQITGQPSSPPPLPSKDFNNCDAEAPLLEQNKNIPIDEHHSHGISSQGDERWVPPSDPYVNLETTNYPSNDQHYHLQYSSNNQIHHNHSKDVTIGKVPLSPPLSRISQTPLNETSSMDCIPDCIQSPYPDVHPQAKWADSEIMPNRRSSSSSAASTSSSCSRRNDDDDLLLKRQDVMMVNHPVLDNLSYLHQALPFPPEPFPPFSETSQFAPPPVSLFPPPSSLAFTSTAPTMFPPAFGAPFPTPHSVISLPKTVTETVPYSNVAFTASQHNLALTAAMVNLPKELEEQHQQQEEDRHQQQQQHVQQQDEQPPPAPIIEPPPPPPQPPSPIVSNNSINQLSSPSPSIKSNNSSVGKKSPSKPTRSSTRVINKSPGKSPAPSVQESVNKNAGRGRDARKNAIKSTASSGRGGQTQMRGRGRGRGRGRPPPLQHNNDYDMITNTIHNKLVGTVYDLDFDDENSNDNMTDLKSMRERRKSIDLHDRKNETIIKDSLDSPKNRSYNADLRDLRPPTPIAEFAKIDEVSDKPIFPDIVEPVLPGPVDMRTYSGGFEQQPYTERNLLQAFATGTAESQVHEEIDEEFEKELQTALTPVARNVAEPVASELGNIKVSLSDSRNQLKVKIKGPIANYSSTIAPLQTPNVDPVQASIVSNNSSISNNSVSSGTTNLRRMRKKELLRQYWTQDMNMDDSSSSTAPGFNIAAVTVPHVNRTIITIPKAVASMTSIPTKEDYRDYRTGDDIEPPPKSTKTKSRPGGLSRELKQLDLTLDENGGIVERRRSSIDASKRRGRPPRSHGTTPKLKIKFGDSGVGGAGTPKVVMDRIRPPKKRLQNLNNKPSVEDLKRESMKFRKMVMADFGDIKEKRKRKKKDKSEKRKRKRAKMAEVQIISNEENSTKMIFRMGKKSSNNEKDKVVSVEKATPIKLKLSRCQEGSGYVMKQSPGTETKEEETVQPGQPPPMPSPPPSVSVPEPPPLEKDCEVR